MVRYKLTPEAECDLEIIWHDTAENWGVKQAINYVNDLDRMFGRLAETPLICRLRTELDPPVHIHHHAKHLIVYVVADTHISIVRILHERMDFEDRLSENE